MMITLTMRLTLLVLVIALSACSTKYQVEELPSDIKSGDQVDGVPFRINQRYHVQIYKKGTGGYESVAEFTRTLPNPDKIYVLKLHGGLLANSTASFNLNPDDTLSMISVASEGRAAQVLGELGTQTQAITTAIAAQQAAEEAQEAADEAETIADEDQVLAALVAQQVVESAQATLEASRRQPQLVNVCRRSKR